MRDGRCQSHTKWDCKYHAVFVPKYRRRAIYGTLRRQMGGILRDLCQQQGVEIVEGYAMPDHIHLYLSIPLKYSVANTIGFLKGKSAIRIPRECLGQKRNFSGLHFWAYLYQRPPQRSLSIVYLAGISRFIGSHGTQHTPNLYPKTGI